MRGIAPQLTARFGSRPLRSVDPGRIAFVRTPLSGDPASARSRYSGLALTTTAGTTLTRSAGVDALARPAGSALCRAIRALAGPVGSCPRPIGPAPCRSAISSRPVAAKVAAGATAPYGLATDTSWAPSAVHASPLTWRIRIALPVTPGSSHS